MASPQAYIPGPVPLIEGGDGIYTQAQLQLISNAINANQGYLPQPATKPPVNPQDGWVRLARSPWRPIGGTADVWVFYDATVPGWVAFP